MFLYKYLGYKVKEYVISLDKGGDTMSVVTAATDTPKLVNLYKKAGQAENKLADVAKQNIEEMQRDGVIVPSGVNPAFYMTDEQLNRVSDVHAEIDAIEKEIESLKENGAVLSGDIASKPQKDPFIGE